MPRAILIGPPGAGKSTVARALSKRLNVLFADTDQLIEERAGKKITEIFIEDGEARFRELEEEIVAEQLSSAEGILALGGGAVMSARTQVLLAAHLER